VLASKLRGFRRRGISLELKGANDRIELDPRKID
jgi:hypothetical protein